MMKAFHNKDVEMAHTVLESKEEIIKECENIYLNNKKIENVGLLIERVKGMITNVHNLGRVIYQSTFTP